MAGIDKVKHLRFNYLVSWDFSIGISISKCMILNYKLVVGIDLGFLSAWVYFIKTKKQ